MDPEFLELGNLFELFGMSVCHFEEVFAGVGLDGDGPEVAELIGFFVFGEVEEAAEPVVLVFLLVHEADAFLFVVCVKTDAVRGDDTCFAACGDCEAHEKKEQDGLRFVNHGSFRYFVGGWVHSQEVILG